MSQSSFFGEAIDLTGVDTRSNFEPLPAGWYTAIPEEITPKIADNGSRAAKIKLRITGPTAANRVVFDNHMVVTHTTSSKADDIGRKRLASWCDAAGVGRNLSSFDVFLGREVAVKLKIEGPRTVGDRTYDASNRIEGFAPANATAPVATPVPRVAAVPATAPAPVAAAQPAERKRMPWETPAA